MPELLKTDYIIPMDQDDDFDATEMGSGPAALLRLEIRYLRRDIGKLQEAVREGLASKAHTADVEDHEKRIRALEQRVYWALGFGAAAGGAAGFLSKLI